MRAHFTALILIICCFLSACGKETAKAIHEEGTLITTTQPSMQNLEIVEETVGTLESLIDPAICAEISGKIEKIFVRPGDHVKKNQVMALLDAHDVTLQKQSSLSEVIRLETLLANQKRTTVRYKELREDNYVSQSMLEEALSNEKVLQEQLKAAKSNLALIERNIAKTRLISPIDAWVETQLSSEGAFVKTGDAVFKIVTTGVLRARLPFPENLSSQLKPALQVRLSTPTAPNDIVLGQIKEIKPMTSTTNRSLDAIVEINNHGSWKPGSSVKAQVVLSLKEKALMIPEQSVVLRPAGKVVYVISENKAIQKVIETGVKQNGMIEVVNGLTENEVIAVDGAGFLSDLAVVKVNES